MSDLTTRIEAFVKLGVFFNEFCNSDNKQVESKEELAELFSSLEEKIALSQHKNGWFTRENILYSLQNWAQALSEENLKEWTSNYAISESKSPKTVALILAGNIPLVGFHDFLSVLITGHKALVKLSSNDNILLPFVADILIHFQPEFEHFIQFEKEKLTDFDMVIATGSNNTARYFEHYFKNKPHIIRKNRNSAAILTGDETKEDLQALGEDIFRYFGLGCRSVSKVFVPKNYKFDSFFEAIYNYHPIIELAKYANNYDYNNAVYLMSEYILIDNGFLILKDDKSYSSPIASLFYESYDHINDIIYKLDQDKEQIQCIVASGVLTNEIKFGTTQKPSLQDYADNMDTVDFLLRNS